MKRLIILTGIVFLFLGLQAQVASYNDIAPGGKIKENSVQSKQGNTFLDKDPNAKVIPIPSDDIFDLIFEFPCAIGGGEAGIETDGIFIYTTKWNGDQFYKYEIDGTFLDTLIISGVSNIRDLAYDGTYFFGGAASTTVYELDFENSILISSFTAPTDVRAIAYNDNEDIFLANNWGSDITKFDKSGNLLGSFSVGPVGDSYYGFAFDSFCYPQYLYGYAQAGATQNEIIQIELPSGYETGLTFNVGSVLTGSDGIAGGLCADFICFDNILIGISQNEYIWGLELCSAGCCPENDLGIHSIIEPASGVGYTNNEPVTIKIENFGTNPQTNFIVSFTHNGSPPYYDTVFATINFDETFDFTFDTTINMATGETHIIEACTNLAGDECTLNDCKTKVLWSGLFGNLEGYLTNCESSAPIEGGTVNIAGYSSITGTDGYFYFESLPVGTWELTFNAPGFCPPSAQVMVTIEVGQTTSADICLSPAQFDVEPNTLNVTLEPNATTIETIILSNPGTCNIDWSANLEIFPPSNTDDFLDAQFQHPVTGGTGQTGIECDGEYFYVSSTNGQISKYALDGTFIEILSISFSGSDLAFNGTYFYGGNGSTTVYEMDFYTQILVSTFTAPENVRAIAYNHDQDIFYGYSWGGNIIAFDPSGALIATAPVGLSGASYSGFAFDNSNVEGPYLWGYGLVGADPNTLVQIQLPDLVETGLIISLGNLLPEPLFNSAGGLFTHPDIFPGTWTLGGIVTDEWIWGLELSEYYTWISINPTSGTIVPGETEEMTVNFDASNILPWIYEAEIQFSTLPETEPPIVDITLDMGCTPFITGLEASTNCVTVELSWDIVSSFLPESYNVYRDGEIIANVQDKFYIDSLLFPENTYQYEVSAVFDDIGETFPLPTDPIYIPLPEDLEPQNLSYTILDDLIKLSWNSPAGCVIPQGYNIYQNNTLLFTTTDTTIIISLGFYDYYTTALYYFGESVPSNSIIITGTEEIKNNLIQISPNPAKDNINITSLLKIKSIKLMTSTGQVILEEVINSKNYKINISHFESGIYLIKLDTKEANLIRKIIIE